MPVTPNIIHTAKQIVNAQVVASKTAMFDDPGIQASDVSLMA